MSINRIRHGAKTKKIKLLMKSELQVIRENAQAQVKAERDAKKEL
jgi:hypothetical protein